MKVASTIISKNNLTKVLFFLMISHAFAQRPVEEKAAVRNTELKNTASSFTDDSSNELNLVVITGTHYDGAHHYLPYYLENTKVTSGAPDLRLIDITTRELSAADVDRTKGYRDLITSEFTVSTYSGKSRNEVIMYYRINAIRLNASTGKYEALTGYKPEWGLSKGLSEEFNKYKKIASVNYASSSVLSGGKWYKVAVTKSGIYKIDKALLQSIGLSTVGLDPRTIRVYGNGGKLMAEPNSTFRYDDLQEDAIVVQGESDGTFDAGDYILFYGQGTDVWKRKNTSSCLRFAHQSHYFSDTSYYYITADLGNGKRVANIASSSISPSKTTSSYDYYDYHEQNLTNVVHSGREFYGEKFDLTTSYTFPFSIPDAVAGDSVYVEAGGLSRSDYVSAYTVSFASTAFTYTCPNTSTASYIADFGYPGYNCAGGILNGSQLNVQVTKQTANAMGYFDYVAFNARRGLVMNQSQFCFRDSRAVSGPGTSAAYHLVNNSPATLTVWDVTDPLNPKNQAYTGSGTTLDFTSASDSLREYVVIGSGDYFIPKAYGIVPNQNLHALQQADFVIICNPRYLNQANHLAAIHQQYDTLTTAVATTEQVYNEFSSGTPDIVGLREFVRMLYKRPANTDKATKYLVLLGDGSYNNKDRFLSTNSAMVPTYETPNSWSYTNSFVTDDFFAMMDDTEGDLQSGDVVDIGVGRFPVRTDDEATGCVNKIEAYYKRNDHFDINAVESNCTSNTVSYPQGDWRNWVAFMADDEDNAEHMYEADSIARTVARNYKEYNVDKIIFDSYVQYVTPGGERYPDAVNDLNRRFEKGTLIFNYTGHGGELGLAHERILDVPQILNWRNINNMPLMVTATCEFSRFDNPDITSAGEYCFLNPEGGAVSLFTTVRLAFSNLNFDLNKSFFKFALAPMLNGKTPAIGDLYRETKVDIGFNPQYQNFVILGDPALKLAYPEKRVYTSTINTHTVTSSSTDTLKALAKVTITGYVGDKAGNKMTSFNGVVFPTVFDKSQQITCLENDASSAYAGQPFKFNLQKNIIYKGKAQVTNGDFSFTFMVPKDISYQFGVGKLSYYAHNGIIDANGYSTNVVIGGSDPNAPVDNQGPVVKLYMNDSHFVSGGTTNEKPSLYAEVSDSSGINTVGTGIGHDVVAVMDENSNKPIVLNDYYEANLNSFQSGKVKYPFSDLSEGSHRLSLKVWDVQNNSSTAYTDFVVAKSAELALSHILNYPNPFTTKTKFFIEHNQCCISLKVLIQIYTISGKVVKSINETINNEGFRFDGIEWDGKDEFGDKLARGVYIYKVSVSDGQNKKAEKIEKLVILN